MNFSKVFANSIQRLFFVLPLNKAARISKFELFSPSIFKISEKPADKILSGCLTL